MSVETEGHRRRDTRSEERSTQVEGNGIAGLYADREHGEERHGALDRTPVVLAATSIFDKYGGIQTYMRLLIRALSDLGRLTTVASHHDHDRDPTVRRWADRHDFDFIGGDWSKIDYCGRLLQRSWEDEFALLGHLRLGPIGWNLKHAYPGVAGYGVILHGVEAWRPLTVPERIALMDADVVISTTPYTAQRCTDVNHLDGCRHEILPLALEPDRFTGVERDRYGGDGGDAGDLEVLTVARLGKGERYKGIEETIRAVATLQSRDVGVRYVVIGDGEDRSRLERIARRSGVPGRVEFRGHVPEEELHEAFRSADVFSMPSAGEGFGLVYLEAMWFGLPIIACGEKGAQYVIRDGENGLEVPHGSPEGVADALERLANPTLRAELSERAERDVEERFSFPRFRRDLDAILSRVADEGERVPADLEGYGD